MGCDIHLYVERRVNGVWESADTWNHDPDLYVDPPYEDVEQWDRFYAGRNHDLFALLAGVRNKKPPIAPIAPPRGIPNDAHERLHLIGADGCYHSHSWFTLAELLAHNWTTIVSMAQTRHAVAFAGWHWGDPHKLNPPQHFDRPFIAAEDMIRVNEIEMIELLKTINPDYPSWKNRKRLEEAVTAHFPRHFVECEWQQPLYTLVQDFWAETMPRLVAIGKPDEVRIVFWFDS